MNEERERRLISERIGRLGGRRARQTAERIRLDVAEVTMHISGDLGEVQAKAYGLLTRLGDVVEATEGELSGVIGSGALRLNPAVVSLRFSTAAQSSQVEVRIRGVAPEGLIRQHAGRRAVDQLMALLNSALAE